MQGQRVGYVRVSSFEQNSDRQVEALAATQLFIDKTSGKDTQRLELDAMLSFVREGDTVVEGVVFTGEDSPMANLMLSVMGAFPEEPKEK